MNVTFSVSVLGAGPFAYQWSSNNVAVPGATNATFTLTNVSLSDSGALILCWSPIAMAAFRVATPS